MDNTPVLNEYLNQPPEQPDAPAVADIEGSVPQQPQPDQQVNVINPSGKLVSVPQSQIQDLDLFNNGYKPAESSDIQSAKIAEEQSGVLPTINAAIRGAGRYTLGLEPLAERGAAALLGQEYNPQEVEQNISAHPIASTAGGLGFLGASGILGPIEAGANLIGEAASPITNAIAPYVPNFLMKIGTPAAKLAVENMIAQGIDETSKLVAGDPNQTVDTAISNLTFSGVLGGSLGAGFGVISPAWNALMGSKLGQTLKAFSDRVSGGGEAPVNKTSQAASALGINIPPEVNAGLQNIPEAKEALQNLLHSSTPSGMQAKAAMTTFNNEIGSAAVKSLGKTAEDIPGLSSLSPADTGKELGDTIAKNIEDMYAPTAKKYAEVEAITKNADLPQDTIERTQTPESANNPYVPAQFQESIRPGAMTDTANKIADAAEQNGWLKDPESPQAILTNRVIKALPNNTTLGEFQNYAKQVQQEAYNDFALRSSGVYTGLKNVFQEAEANISNQVLQNEAPQMLETHADAIAGHKAAMDMINPIHDRLPLGSWKGVKSFVGDIKSLGNDHPEKILSALSGKNDAMILDHLNNNFPEAADVLRNYHIDSVLQKAARAARGDSLISVPTLLSSIEKMTPESRNFAIPAEAQNKINTLSDLMDKVPKNPNPSGTAGMMSRLFKYVPAGLAATLAHFNGAGIGETAAAFGATKYLTANAPDALRLSYLKFLGSSQPIDAPAFKTMFDFIHNMAKGDKAVTNAVGNLFKSGAMSLPTAFDSEKDRANFEKNLSRAQTNPNSLFNVGGSLGHYMPEHATVLAQRTASISGYLNSLRPQSPQASPLDAKTEPSKSQLADYHNAQDIAEQPLSVLQKIKEGSLTHLDVVHLNTMYPGLAQTLSQKITEEMANHLSEDGTVPYKLRLGLSQLMMEPLDSTMTPQGIMSAQATFQQNASPTQPAPNARGGKAHSMKALQNIASLDELPNQSRQMSHQGRE